jgi:hypothetical protein
MFMDVVIPYQFRPLLAGLRGPERKYVLIDFETATLPSLDRFPSSAEYEKAFKRDVRLLAIALELNLRVRV